MWLVMQRKYKILVSISIILVVVSSGILGIFLLVDRGVYNNNFATLRGHGWRVREVAFSPVDPILATGSSDGSVRIWDIETGETLHVLSRHHYGVIALAFSPSGKIIASGGYDNKINLWNVSSGEHIKTFSIYPMGVTDLKWLADEESLVVAGGEYMGVETDYGQPEKYLQILNTSNSQILKQFLGHQEAVVSISISDDGVYLLSGSKDNSVRLWDIESGTQINVFQGHTDIVTSVIFSIDQSSIMSASLDGTVKLWDYQSGEMIKELQSGQPIWSISQSPLNYELAIAVDSDLEWPDVYWLTFGNMHNCSIQIWDMEKYKLKEELTGHENTIEAVKFSPDGQYLASASWDWTIKLWGKHPILETTEEIDEWILGTPDEVGIDPDILEDNLSIFDYFKFHSILVLKDGKLIYERYFLDTQEQNFKVTTKHTLFSATKSFTSALVGIAIDKGYINGTDDKLLDYFPELSGAPMDSRVQNITIHHLLTMTSCLSYDEYDDIWAMGVENDSVEHIITRSMYGNPGDYYEYNTGSSQLLSAIIKRATNQSTYEFAIQNLFSPIGIEEEDVVWVSSSDGVHHGGIGLFLTPRNLAKFGQLYLNNGTWDGAQIIPEEWIQLSTIDYMQNVSVYGPWSPPGYGYHFWVEADRYYAMGWGGQMIQVLPEYNLVVISTARMEEYRARTIANLVIQAIIE